MVNGCAGRAQADDSGAGAPGTRTVVRPVAPDPRLGCSGHRRSAGAGSPHHRKMVGRLRRGRAQSPDLRAFRGFPPALEEGQQAELKAAVQEPPTKWGIGLANWNWKAVWQFVQERFGISLSRSSCLNCLHRLGFAFKRPKKRLLQADAEKRDAFVAEYASLKSQGNLREISGARIWGQDILR